ncbi:MAG: hypothetical protein HKN14_02455 [Marinicaulis sp.]|nr:hypothetical protein [Marinicaulis sp.]NNL89480.1 hypothetical protein [Marinicaulis sp.]
MFTRIVILTIAAAAMAACTTANNRAVKSNAAYQEVVDKNPDMTAEEADTAREFVMKEEDGSRVICKRRQVTGSKFQKRICLTWDEWKAIEERSKDYASELDRRNRQVNVPRAN